MEVSCRGWNETGRRAIRTGRGCLRESGSRAAGRDSRRRGGRRRASRAFADQASSPRVTRWRCMNTLARHSSTWVAIVELLAVGGGGDEAGGDLEQRRADDAARLHQLAPGRHAALHEERQRRRVHPALEVRDRRRCRPDRSRRTGSSRGSCVVLAMRRSRVRLRLAARSRRGRGRRTCASTSASRCVSTARWLIEPLSVISPLVDRRRLGQHQGARHARRAAGAGWRAARRPGAGRRRAPSASAEHVVRRRVGRQPGEARGRRRGAERSARRSRCG